MIGPVSGPTEYPRVGVAEAKMWANLQANCTIGPLIGPIEYPMVGVADAKMWANHRANYDWPTDWSN